MWLFSRLLLNDTYFFESLLCLTIKGVYFCIFIVELVVFLTGTHWFWTGTHDVSQDESHVGLTISSKLQLVVYYQCCVLIG